MLFLFLYARAGLCNLLLQGGVENSVVRSVSLEQDTGGAAAAVKFLVHLEYERNTKIPRFPYKAVC